MQHHHLKIETLSLSFRTRWAWWRWKQFIVLEKEKRLRGMMVDQFYCLKLKRTTMDALRLNVVHSHIKTVRMDLAQQFRVKKLQQFAWNVWTLAVEEREELNLAAENDLARQHLNTKVLRKCFAQLLSYAQWRQQRKRQYARADAHYYLHVMPKCLFHMHMFVTLEKTCAENAATAKEFHRINLLEQMFYKWQKASVHSRDDRLMDRMALLHRESVIQSSMFRIWNQRTQDNLHEKQKLAEAREHYLLTLCSRTWGAWVRYTAWKKKRFVDIKKAKHHDYMRLLKTSVSSWKKWTGDKVAEKAKLKKAETHWSHRVLRVCIAHWKGMAAQGKHFKSLADVRFEKCSVILLRLSFVEWRKMAVHLAAERRRLVAARVHHNRVLIQKVVQEWHRFAVIRVYKRSQAKELLREAVEQLQRLKLSLYLKHWKEEMTTALQSQAHQGRADDHYKGCLQGKIFQAWKSYGRMCLKKKLLTRQCLWFHDVRLSAKHFLLWKCRLAEHTEEKGRTQIALWQWSLVLKRKVLLAWKSYTEIRRHKKSRLADAADKWRLRLLKDACSQWLATADSLSHLRSSMAAKHQVKTAFDNFHLLQRCALHWKLWARKRAAAKGVQVMRDTALSLTSNVRFTTKSSQFPILNQIYPSLKTDSVPARTLTSKPTPAFSSPDRPGLWKSKASYPDMQAKPRPPPKRPAFLMDSLKRAGLFHDLNDSADQEDLELAANEVESTPSLSDLRVDAATYQEYPATGRFEPQDHVSPPRRRVATECHDWSFSAEIISGSNSTLGPGEGGIKPLHLSSSDTEPSRVHTGSGTSQSPQMYTPSTQRSQFSGNPLLYSSPLSDINAARETWRANLSEAEMWKAELNGAEKREDKQATDRQDKELDLVKLGFDVERTDLLSGNLEGEGWKMMRHADVIVTQGAKKLERLQQQQQLHQQQQQTDTRVNINQQEAVVLLKPADFMKKPVPTAATLKQNLVDIASSRKGVMKHTPRAFAAGETDQTSGLPPMAHPKSGHLEPSSHLDTQKENMVPSRHTPREVFSPRRSAPQGILHNKVSDSDADASPLNTARSRGTVTFASPKSPSPEEEIINIRDRLRHFSQQKKKLRALSKQYRQLSEWVVEQAGLGLAEDEDSQNATEELDMLRLEVAELQAVVDSQGPICERLILRAQTLAKELHIPFT